MQQPQFFLRDVASYHHVHINQYKDPKYHSVSLNKNSII
jgi:hypothetical protein